MINVQQIIELVNTGKPIYDSQIVEVGNFLRDNIQSSKLEERLPHDIIFEMLLGLRKAKAEDYTGVFEHFMNSSDPLTAELALRTLCLEWGRSEDYVEQLIALSMGVSHDIDSDIRLAAVQALGHFLSSFGDIEGEDIDGGALHSRRESVCILLREIAADSVNPSHLQQAALRALEGDFEDF